MRGEMVYRQVKRLRSTEAAYLAGLIDGEGTISLSRKHRLENRQLVVSISNTERNLLTHAQEVVGAGRITHKRTYSADHTPSSTYVITNRQALGLLEQIAPYLRSYKADRAALILNDYLRLTPRNGRYSPQQWKARGAFIEQFFSIRPHAVDQTHRGKERPEGVGSP